MSSQNPSFQLLQSPSDNPPMTIPPNSFNPLGALNPSQLPPSSQNPATQNGPSAASAPSSASSLPHPHPSGPLGAIGGMGAGLAMNPLGPMGAMGPLVGARPLPPSTSSTPSTTSSASATSSSSSSSALSTSSAPSTSGPDELGVSRSTDGLHHHHHHPGHHLPPQLSMHGMGMGMGNMVAMPAMQSMPAMHLQTVPVTLGIPTQQQQQQQQQQQLVQTFWQDQVQQVEKETDFKNHDLPLARIKKVMKTDDDVKNMMISAEAPVLFAKACEIFILELTMRAWIHTEENKRRTLQRNDIAMAITKTDTFDFLIDIVPRDDIKPSKKDNSEYRSLVAPEVAGYYPFPMTSIPFLPQAAMGKQHMMHPMQIPPGSFDPNQLQMQQHMMQQMQQQMQQQMMQQQQYHQQQRDSEEEEDDSSED